MTPECTQLPFQRHSKHGHKVTPFLSATQAACQLAIWPSAYQRLPSAPAGGGCGCAGVRCFAGGLTGAADSAACFAGLPPAAAAGGLAAFTADLRGGGGGSLRGCPAGALPGGWFSFRPCLPPGGATAGARDARRAAAGAAGCFRASGDSAPVCTAGE